VGIFASGFAIEEWTYLLWVVCGKQPRRDIGSEKRSEEMQGQLCFQAGGHLK
jgi:hypothetical protein